MRSKVISDDLISDDLISEDLDPLSSGTAPHSLCHLQT